MVTTPELTARARGHGDQEALGATTPHGRRPAPETDLTDLARQRFPLLPRKKPVCRSLTDRIERVRRQALLASQHTEDALLRAAEAHNLAALILSDCSMAQAARDLCRHQFDLFAASGPYDQATAKLALQPLVNLGRLHTRDGNGNAAYQVHEALFHAAQSRSEAVIDGTRIDLDRIVRPGDIHLVIVRWLWTILLADGLRALCRAGHWSEALHHAEHHHGIGERLFDGRQIAIIARSTAHDHAEALRLIDATVTPTAWERAVAACLRVICLTRAGQPTTSAIDTMMDTYLEYDAEPDDAVFHVRLGLSVAELATDVHDIQPVIRMITNTAADAYAARETLASDLPLTEPVTQALNELVRSAGLNTAMPPALLADLMEAVQTNETTITGLLAMTANRT